MPNEIDRGKSKIKDFILVICFKETKPNVVIAKKKRINFITEIIKSSPQA